MFESSENIVELFWKIFRKEVAKEELKKEKELQ
jgi:hypothetical protein